jgi:hypothetical protein
MRLFGFLCLVLCALSLTHAYQLAWKDTQVLKRAYQSERTFQIDSKYYHGPQQAVRTAISETVTGQNADGTAAVTRLSITNKGTLTEKFARKASGEKLGYTTTGTGNILIASVEGDTMAFMTSLYFPDKDLAIGEKWEHDFPVMCVEPKGNPTMKAVYTLAGTQEVAGKSYLQITVAIADTHKGVQSANADLAKFTYDIDCAVTASVLWDAAAGEVFSAEVKEVVTTTTYSPTSPANAMTNTMTDKLTKAGADVIAPAVLKLTTTPAGATVLVDGAPQPQTTPCTVTLPFTDFTPRTVKLEIRLDGYKTITANGVLKPGETKTLTLTLKPAQ